MGFFMIGASTISLVAVNFTTATNASLVNATQPTTTVLAAWLVLKIKLTKIQTAGIIAAAIGILIMISRADFQVLANLEFNKGEFNIWCGRVRLRLLCHHASTTAAENQSLLHYVRRHYFR